MRGGSVEGATGRSWGILVAVAVLAGVFAWLALTIITTGRPRSAIRQPVLESPGFELSPTGKDVPRLTPIRVTFEKAPGETRGPRLLQLEPVTQGTYTWLSERTLQFQPDFPGLLRGFRYRLNVPAQPDAALPATVTQEFTTEGELTVSAVIPGPGDMEVPLEGQIIVQFSRSVAPLTLLGEQPVSPVVVADPPLSGKGEWLNTSLYRLIPESLLPNTGYALRIPAGLTSAADGVLQEDFHWTFTTVTPAVSSIVPDQNTQYVGPRQRIAMTFNQAMDRASVEAGFQLSRSDGSTISGTFDWSDDGAVATFTPRVPLSYEAMFEIVLPSGLKGARGGETAQEWRSTFTTAGEPRVSRTTPGDGATDAPRYSAQVIFSNPMDRDSAEARVSVSGLDTKQLRFYWQNDTTLLINVSLKPSTRYIVSIAQGALDRYGQSLPPYSFSFTTGRLPSVVSYAVPTQIATYSASAQPVLFYHTTNLSEVTFTLYPLTAEEARLHQQRGFLLPGNQALQPTRAPIRTWSERVESKLDEVVLSSTPLAGGERLPLGDYYVVSSGDVRSMLLFSVVNAALVTKLSSQELLVWALDHDTGRPLSSVTVHASGPGLNDAGQTTDGQGIATFTVPNSVDQRSSGPYLVTLDGGGYRGIVSTRWQQGSQPYQLSILTDFPREYVGHVYTDRPIYRPGEQVEYKGVVRLDDDAAYKLPAESPPLVLVVRDALGKEIKKDAVELNEYGTFAGSLTLPVEARTGSYGLAIQTTARSNFVAGNSFLVAEFRKPEFQVGVEAGKAEYLAGESIAAATRASFFFGGAVANAPARWSVLSSPFVVRIPGFAGYSFTDYDYYRPDVLRDTTRASGKSVTNEAGQLAFSTPATISGNEGTQEYRISVAVTDQNAQEVSAATNVTVHPAEFYVGVKPTRYVALAGKEASVQLVTVDAGGRRFPTRSVIVKVYERTWITTKEQTPDGARRYRSEPQDTLIATLETTTDAAGLGDVKVTPPSPGTLRIVAEATDETGRVARSAAFLWVSAPSGASWQISNDDLIKLVADKDSYEVGETAQVLVPSPFDGAFGLVAVERGKIISRSTQGFATNSERLEIPITDRHVPNVFVSVVLYRPPTETDPVPRYKVGYVNLPVSTATRVLNVSIAPDRDQAQPGQRVRYSLRVTDSSGRGVKSELSVAIVDKALLSLAEERGPNGLRAFWFERGLGVFTASSLSVSVNRLNDVIAEARQGGKGGGGLEDERIRQDFRNTAYWQAQLATDADGRASVEVTLPDNVTTWRMQTRAVSGDTMVGEGTNELLSTKPLLLRPALPRFLRAGDSLSLRLLAHNATQRASSVEVSLEADAMDLSGDASRTIVVPAMNR